MTALDRLADWPAQTYAAQQETIVTVRRAVLAAMETGQHGTARTLVTELNAVNLDAGRKLRADVVNAYSIDL